MGKKAGAVKEKRSAKARVAKSNISDKPEKKENTPQEVPQRKFSSLLRLTKKGENQMRTKDGGKAASAKPGDQKKLPAKGKEHRAKEVGQPKYMFWKESVKFFQGTWSELKKVHWPTSSEVMVYTGVVLASVVFVSLLIWIADSVFSRLLELLIGI